MMEFEGPQANVPNGERLQTLKMFILERGDTFKTMGIEQDFLKNSEIHIKKKSTEHQHSQLSLIFSLQFISNSDISTNTFTESCIYWKGFQPGCLWGASKSHLSAATTHD